MRAHGLVRKLAVDLGERYTPERATIKAYTVYDERQRAVLDLVAKIKAEIREYVRQCRGIVFYGPPGTGKTHLLANLCYTAAAAGFPCRYFRGGQVYRRFNDSFSTAGIFQVKILQDLCASPRSSAWSDPDPPKDSLTGPSTSAASRRHYGGP